MIQQPLPDAESDTALLACFASVRDEAAFAELMRRRGPMVLGVCARMLRQQQDAEDALQAVFLTVASRARALRRVRSVAGWLHNVAVRISLNSLKMKRRREQKLRRLQQDRSEPDRDEADDWKELLDEELAQLPARLKEIVILRDLEVCRPWYTRRRRTSELRLPQPARPRQSAIARVGVTKVGAASRAAMSSSFSTWPGRRTARLAQQIYESGSARRTYLQHGDSVAGPALDWRQFDDVELEYETKNRCHL